MVQTIVTTTPEPETLEEIGEAIRRNHEAFEYFGRKAVEVAIDIGQLLLAAKAQRPHGGWLEWIGANTPYSEDQAERFMRVAANSAIVRNLDPHTSLSGALASIARDRQIERARAKAAPKSLPSPEYDEEAFEDVDDVAGFPIGVSDAAKLKHLNDGDVGLQLFSPPYNVGIQYPGGIRDDWPYHEYLRHVSDWCDEAYRVAADNGRICVNVPIDTFSPEPRPLMADWLTMLQDSGWTYRTTIFWTKGGAGHTVKHVARGTEGPDAPYVFAAVEAILVCHKGDWNLRRREAHDLDHEEWLRWTDGIWNDILPARRNGFPVPWPQTLAERLIKLFSYPGDLIMDQFLGSGTTALAAFTLGRRFVGSDISKQSVWMARRSLHQLVRSHNPA